MGFCEELQREVGATQVYSCVASNQRHGFALKLRNWGDLWVRRLTYGSISVCLLAQLTALLLSIVIPKVAIAFIPNQSKVPRMPFLAEIHVVSLDNHENLSIATLDPLLQLPRISKEAMLILERVRIVRAKERVVHIVPLGFEVVRLLVVGCLTDNPFRFRVEVPRGSFPAVRESYFNAHYVAHLQPSGHVKSLRSDLSNSEVWCFTYMKSFTGNFCLLLNCLPLLVGKKGIDRNR